MCILAQKKKLLFKSTPVCAPVLRWIFQHKSTDANYSVQIIRGELQNSKIL